MSPSRREFLKMSSLLFTVGSVASNRAWSANSNSSFCAVGYSPTATQKGNGINSLYPTYPSELRIFNSKFELKDNIPLPFFPHSFLQNPNNPFELIVIEKWGIDAAILDLKQKKIIKKIFPGPGVRFFGHGACLPSGDLLISAMDDKKAEGKILVYRQGDLKESFSSFGVNPHEIKIAPNDPNKLVVLNLGGTTKERQGLFEPRIVWIDLKTKKSSRILKSKMSGGPTHFAFLEKSADQLIVGGTHTTPAIEIINGKEHSLLEMISTSPNNKTYETLNFLLSQDQFKECLVSCPEADAIFSLDLEKRKVKSIISKFKARHIFESNGKKYYSYETHKENRSHLVGEDSKGWTELSIDNFGNSPHIGTFGDPTRN
ncbi:MAG: DUF1513 domain-containing protein [Bdellovibrionota bacterium]